MDGLREALTCPICLDLLHRVCVLSCGHWACHACSHRAMNPGGTSKCAMCRHEYAHWPAACMQLHAAVERIFPEDVRRLDHEREALPDDDRDHPAGGACPAPTHRAGFTTAAQHEPLALSLGLGFSGLVCLPLCVSMADG